MFISEKQIDVRYAETDQMGVVYHANYLVWLELGRTQLISDLGLSYIKMEEDGIVSPVLDLQISYKKALRYGDTAIVKTWITSVTPLRVIYGYEVLNQHGELCVTAETTNVCVKKETFRPVSFKKLYPDWYEVYEKANQEA
ncbi:thioesterase family protein [Bacillus sp. 165]|uniref:acyl-CoA thioesterase n=1 Tax=Bacillus sp. 165 TaxID=1529117 RepID=UPI001ADB7E83|nr:thioesterase family protein [Bacillus sp. 165]MBO9129057.1 acyl-CoA thioesterase [Bacillus sp. 165]